MNRIFIIPVLSLFLILIPVFGWLLTIVIICVWYFYNQDKIHYVITHENNTKYNPKKDKTYKKEDISKDELESLK